MENRLKDLQIKTTAIQALAMNFGKEIPEFLLEVWLDGLEKYTAEQVRAGCVYVIENYTYKTLPPFGVLKDAINKTAPGFVDKKDLAVAAESEWIKLREGIARIGRYRTPTFENKTTAFVVKSLGGWGVICDWYTDEMPFRHKEFVDLWVNSYGKEDVMALGADSVLKALIGNLGTEESLDKALPSQNRQLPNSLSTPAIMQ